MAAPGRRRFLPFLRLNDGSVLSPLMFDLKRSRLSADQSPGKGSLSHRLCAELAHHGDDSRVFPLAGFKVSDGDASDSRSFSALSLSLSFAIALK